MTDDTPKDRHLCLHGHERACPHGCTLYMSMLGDKSIEMLPPMLFVLDVVGNAPTITFKVWWNQPVPFQAMVMREGVVMTMGELHTARQLRTQVWEWLEDILPKEFYWDVITMSKVHPSAPAHLPYKIKEAPRVLPMSGVKEES